MRKKDVNDREEQSSGYDLFTFSNGIRLVHKQVKNTKISHCGFVLDIGSRDEQLSQQGIAHFWEHMAFKGTQKRKAFHILSRVDAVGGELNAYTTKEKVCFYASLLTSHFEKAVELLTDITFNSTFPEKEIKKEKGVILEEMAMYEDDPSDAISDEFDEVIFGDHPLGRNILGTRDSVEGFQQEDFMHFIRENLDTSRVVFSCVSELSFDRVKKIVSKHISDIPQTHKERVRDEFTQYKSVIRKVEKQGISQGHCVLGATAHSLFDKDRIPFFMLVNLLGGPGMNSRLNLAVREKYGFVYDIHAQLNSFLDTGVFNIYFATEQRTLERCIQIVFKELKKLREQPLGTMQLHTAKQQLMGQLAMAEESNLGLMLVIGKNILDKETVDPLGKIFDQIREATAEKLLELANDFFPEDRLSMLIYEPEEEG